MASELKPCPNPKCRGTCINDSAHFGKICDDCGLRGPADDDGAKWNLLPRADDYLFEVNESEDCDEVKFTVRGEVKYHRTCLKQRKADSMTGTWDCESCGEQSNIYEVCNRCSYTEEQANAAYKHLESKIDERIAKAFRSYAAFISELGESPEEAAESQANTFITKPKPKPKFPKLSDVLWLRSMIPDVKLRELMDDNWKTFYAYGKTPHEIVYSRERTAICRVSELEADE